jgi:hypothetical protein
LEKENLLKLSNSKEYKIVLTSVASIYNKPSFNSELITQALIWEELIIHNKKDDWYKVKQRDGYVGWIHSFYITDTEIYENNKFLKNLDSWYWVKDKFIPLLLNDSSQLFITYGSLIPCFEEANQFYTLLPNNQKIKINKNSLISFIEEINRNKNISYSVKELLGIPYLWGGKSSFGFDCSGLVQSIVNVCNINSNNYTKNIFPRDSYQQIISNILKENNKSADIGDVIFFKSNDRIDHVGIYINNVDFIHSSGYVKLNSIDSSSIYYCSDLAEKYFKTFKILD